MFHRALFLAGTLFAPLAAAQERASEPELTDLDLEELMQVEIDSVVSASLHLQRTFDAPSSVTVIESDEIRAHGYRTLLEILRSVTGMYVSYDRNYAHVGVRGFFAPGDYNTRVLLLVDGHRINDAIFGGYGLDFDAPVDPDLIDRVEIIRGPGSALYGSNALFAVVNVVSKRGRDCAGFEGALEGASHDTYLARGTVGGGDEDSQWLVSARAFTSAGDGLFYGDFAATPSGGWTRGTDYEHAYSVHAQYDWDDWTCNAAYVWREKGMPTGSYGTVFGDDENRTIDATGFADVTWRPEAGAGRSTLLRAYLTDYRYDGWYVYDDTANGGPPDLVYRDRAIGQTLGLDLQLALDRALGGRLTVGAEARWNFAQDQKGWDDLYGTYFDETEESLEWGAFAQDEIALSERTTLVAGGRFDHYESFGGTTTPRAALVHAPDESTAFKLLYGEAFRAPNASELAYNVGSIASVPDLEPERMWTAEAVAEHVFAGGWRASASLFHYEVDDLLVRTVDPVTSELLYRNVGAVSGDGVELEIEKRFTGGRRARLSQALQEVEDGRTGDRPANSPRYVAQLAAETPAFTERLLAGLEVIYVGSRGTLAGDTVDGYALVNVALRAPEIAPGVELSVVARNLFDASYADPVGPEIVQDAIEQDGFALALRLRVRR
jgi:iron complex outermembrane receptor protein